MDIRCVFFCSMILLVLHVFRREHLLLYWGITNLYTWLEGLNPLRNLKAFLLTHKIDKNSFSCQIVLRTLYSLRWLWIFFRNHTHTYTYRVAYLDKRRHFDSCIKQYANVKNRVQWAIARISRIFFSTGNNNRKKWPNPIILIYCMNLNISNEFLCICSRKQNDKSTNRMRHFLFLVTNNNSCRWMMMAGSTKF